MEKKDALGAFSFRAKTELDKVFEKQVMMERRRKEKQGDKTEN